MPDNEITIIEPNRLLKSLELRDLWRHRELLFFMVWRDVMIRYKQTFIGVAWAILQPVLTTAVFTVIFSNFARFDTSEVPYPLFALSGVMIWLFVHTSITMASNSFVTNTNLVTKIYFPRLILPLAATIAALTDLIFSLVIAIMLMFYFGVAVTPQVLYAPLFLLLAILLAASLGTLFSALNVRFRDVKFALPFLLQVWMIASPIFYPTSLLSEKWRLVFAVNPITGILSGFRSSLFGTSFDWQVIGVSSISIILIAVISLLVFKWMEDDFADIV
ncbi:MAG: ABC transporter permease [Pyrinomonadaceae bacterium]|nr:ABC transporter permease [Pyrinomonadaceae bacterium]